MSRIGDHEWPLVITDTVRATVEGLAAVTGRDLDPEDVDSWLPLLGGAARMIGATIRNTANPTMLEAGYKANVIPSKAEATIDTRFLPGQEERAAGDDRRARRPGHHPRDHRVRHRGRDGVRRRAGRRDGRRAAGRGPGRRTRCRT